MEKRQDYNDSSRTFQTLIIAGLILFISITYVWQRVMIVEIGYKTESLRREKAELSRANAELLTEVSSLASLKRIERIASANLGMRRPEKGEMIIVREIRPSPVMIGVVEKDSNLMERDRG